MTHIAGACAHSGDVAGDREFDSNVFHFLILIKAYLILFEHYRHLILYPVNKI